MPNPGLFDVQHAGTPEWNIIVLSLFQSLGKAQGTDDQEKQSENQKE